MYDIDKQDAFRFAELDQFDFHHRIADTAGIALVSFMSPNCGGCRHLRRVLQAVGVQRPDWHLYEIDAQRDAGLTREFEVFHLPAMFLFRNGRFHCALQAEARPASITAAVETALRQPPAEAP